jgi:hypothetical protein
MRLEIRHTNSDQSNYTSKDETHQQSLRSVTGTQGRPLRSVVSHPMACGYSGGTGATNIQPTFATSADATKGKLLGISIDALLIQLGIYKLMGNETIIMNDVLGKK